MAAPIHAPESTSEPPYCRMKIFLDSVLREKLLHVNFSLSHITENEQLYEMLLAEKRLLHVSIYKRSAQLRIEKSLQLVKRVRSCLQRLHTVERLLSLASDMSMDINKALKSQNQDTEAFVPSQQVFSYVLYLISNYYHLLGKTTEYTVAAFDCQFSTGTLIPTMVLYMGIMARVWQLCRAMQMRFASVYAVIYPIHLQMKPTASDWVCPSIPTKLLSPVLQSDLENSQRSTTVSTCEKMLTMASQRDNVQAMSLDDVGKIKSGVPAESCITSMEDLGVAVQSLKRKRKRYDDSVGSSKKMKTILKQSLDLKSLQPNINNDLLNLKDNTVEFFKVGLSKNAKIKKKKQKANGQKKLSVTRPINGSHDEDIKKLTSSRHANTEFLSLHKIKKKKKLSKKENPSENAPASWPQGDVHSSTKNNMKKKDKRKILKKKQNVTEFLFQKDHENRQASDQEIQETKSHEKKKGNSKKSNISKTKTEIKKVRKAQKVFSHSNLTDVDLHKKKSKKKKKTKKL